MKRFMIVLGVILILLELASAALAADGYHINRWTVDSGGTLHSQSGSYVLGGTQGQPDAGELGGGAYRLNGGFWSGGSAATRHLYLPAIVR